MTPLDMKPNGANVQDLFNRIKAAMLSAGVGIVKPELKWDDGSECFQLVTQVAEHVFIVHPLSDEQVERIESNTAAMTEEATSFILNVLGTTGFMRASFPTMNVKQA